MTSGSDPLAFTRLMPGFDFMRQFARTAADKNAAFDLAGWVAPTVSIEELDKRIADLKAVQFWLEQNLHVLRATVQALQVQKMTLAALQGMNLNLANVAKAFAAPGPSADAGALEPAAQADSGAAGGQAAAQPESAAAAAQQATPAAFAGVDPLQWWGALTRQFQEIAANAVHEAAQAAPPAAADAAATAKSTRRSAIKTGAKPAVKPMGKQPGKRTAQKKSAHSAPRKGAA